MLLSLTLSAPALASRVRDLHKPARGRLAGRQQVSTLPSLSSLTHAVRQTSRGARNEPAISDPFMAVFNVLSPLLVLLAVGPTLQENGYVTGY